MGTPGTYTRRKGLDHETNKQLLLKHLADRSEKGAPMRELQQVLPAQPRRSILRMLNEMTAEGVVALKDKGRNIRWISTPHLNGTND